MAKSIEYPRFLKREEQNQENHDSAGVGNVAHAIGRKTWDFKNVTRPARFYAYVSDDSPITKKG